MRISENLLGPATFVPVTDMLNSGFSLAPTKKSSSHLSESIAANLSPLARSVVGEMRMTYHCMCARLIRWKFDLTIPRSERRSIRTTDHDSASAIETSLNLSTEITAHPRC